MKTIRLRLLITFIAVILITGGVILFAQAAWLERYLIDDKAALLKEQNTSISQFASIYVGRPENLANAADSLLTQFGRLSGGELALYDNHGLLIQSTSDTAGFSAPLLLANPGAGAWPRREVYKNDGRRWLSVSTPIGSPAVGFVMQTVSLEEIDRALAASERRLLYATLLALAGAGAVSVVLARTLSQPLLRLRDAALSLAGGDLSVRVCSRRMDEVGEVSRSIDHMADQITHMLAASEADRRRLSAILTNFSEGLLALDEHDRVLIANPAAARLFGMRAADLPGRDAYNLLPSGRLKPIVQAARESGGLYAHEMDWPFDEAATIRITCAPLELESGPGLVVTLRNTTDVRKLEEHRQENISRLSHELRTPLTIIKGYLITLLDTPDEQLADERDALAIMDRETERLARMVEELLDYSRQRSAIMRLKMAPEALDAIIRESVAGLQSLAARCNVSLHFNKPARIPPVPMSRDHIKQVMLNLLDNAIKYNHSGGRVDVSMQVLPDSVAVEVRDTGRGIPAGDLPFIFDRYFRAGESFARGSGLGLPIVKEIIAAHGGEITVTSSEKGTTIRFILPAWVH